MKQADEISVSHLDGKLLDAVIENEPAAVVQLLEEGANPNCYEDKCQIRPLHFACVYNSIDVIYPLVKAGANVDAITSDGYKPIDIAKQLNHSDLAEILQALGTNLVSLFE